MYYIYNQDYQSAIVIPIRLKTIKFNDKTNLIISGGGLNHKLLINEIQNRLKDVLLHIDKDRLIVAPDCGLGHLSRKLTMKKLKTMVQAVKNF